MTSYQQRSDDWTGRDNSGMPNPRQRESMSADRSNLRPGDPVAVSGSREGGRVISYRGTVLRALRSGTVLIADADRTDGIGNPILHYCANGQIEPRQDRNVADVTSRSEQS